MKAKFNVCCMASYKGELELSDEVDISDETQVLDYILKHLDEVPVKSLEFLNDTDEPVLESDIYYIGE